MTTQSHRPILVAVAAAIFVAVAGGAASKIGPWYRDLIKPAANPPDWVFAPAWTLIYALCVVAAVRGWRACETSAERAWLLSLFFINAVLNVLWSALFFTAQRPDWALAEVVTLWLSILALVVFFWPRSRSASLLLMPYLVWVAFAAWLNLRIVELNAPFAAAIEIGL
ncbi:MAG: TspO/MBR family protein [Pseudomonadota bacterium]